MPRPLVEFRCPTPGCERLICKVSDVPGMKIEAICPRCKVVAKAELREDEH